MKCRYCREDIILMEPSDDGRLKWFHLNNRSRYCAFSNFREAEPDDESIKRLQRFVANYGKMKE